MIEYWIDETPATGLRVMSIWVMLRDTTTNELRQFEVPQILQELDPIEYIATNYTKQEMWDAGIIVAVMDSLAERKILKALVSLLLDEINLLREHAGMSLRTKQQFINAMKQKLEEG